MRRRCNHYLRENALPLFSIRTNQALTTGTVGGIIPKKKKYQLINYEVEAEQKTFIFFFKNHIASPS